MSSPEKTKIKKNKTLSQEKSAPKKQTEKAISLNYNYKRVNFDELAEDKQIVKILPTAKLYASLEDPILIFGETGTGKNLLAQAIHNFKFNTPEKFCEVICSGIPEKLFETELFGCVRGAYPDATNRQGYVYEANGGTLFLDELGELSLELQAKLLRLVEQKRFYKVGSSKEEKANIRIICATNKTLEELRNPKVFRQDLLYRFTLQLKIPALREMPGDLDAKIQYFLDKYTEEIVNKIENFPDSLKITKLPTWIIKDEQKGTIEASIDASIRNMLLKHTWPGNNRELKSVLKMALYRAITSDAIEEEHFHPWIENQSKTALVEEYPGMESTLDEVEKWHIARVYESCQKNITATGKKLGIKNWGTTQSKLKEYNLL